MDLFVTWFLRYLVIILTLFFIGFRLIRRAIDTLNYVRKIEKLDGPPVPWHYWFWNGNLFLLGNFKENEVTDKLFPVLSTVSLLYREKLVRIWLSVQPIVIVHRADQAEDILSSNVNINKSRQYDMLRPWLNEGLLLSGGSKWHQRRKFLTPTFHFNILEEFVPIMNEQATIMSEIIAEKIKSDKESYLDIVPLVTNAALDIISETAMGVKINAQQNPKQEYVQGINRLAHVAFKRMIYPWYQNDLIYFNLVPEGRTNRKDLDNLHRFTTDVISKRKAAIIEQLSQSDDVVQKDKRRRLAFMDLLIEQHLVNPANFTELDIREEVDTFMFEGHDTTAMSMIWTLYLLGNHPDIQRRVQEEIDEIQANADQTEQLFWTQSQIRKMKFLEACIKESLRLYPSVPFIGRIAEEDIRLQTGEIIPKGTTTFIYLWGIQRDPKYFKKPDFFIPDRFIENSEHYQGKINPFAFVPFSAGPRNCIGQKFALQEEKIVLATLLSRFNVRSELPVNEARYNPELILRPKNVVKVKFQIRNV